MISQKTIDLIKSFEGLKLEAYLDSVKVPTIGYGTTKYPTGQNVKIGDKITKEQAEEYIKHDIEYFAKGVKSAIDENIHLNDNQFGALVSFSYNLGLGNLKTSSLLKRVNMNPNDPAIRTEFMKWINAGGKPLEGLKRRRAAEADLYFTK